MKRPIELPSGIVLDGFGWANLFTDVTGNADGLIDQMRFLGNSGDRLNRAVAHAGSAACTQLWIYLIAHKGAANFGWTTFFKYMRFVFLTKMFERAFHRVWRTLTKSTEAIEPCDAAKLFKLFNVFRFSLPCADLC